MTRKHYYYVRLHGITIRVAHAETPITALRDTFGYGVERRSCSYKDLGTRSPAYFSATKKADLKANKDWIDYK